MNFRSGRPIKYVHTSPKYFWRFESQTSIEPGMYGVLTFMFYPDLINPVKEHEINQGRKRVDIKFTNADEAGFFRRMADGKGPVPWKAKRTKRERWINSLA
jgi:hypothetical protein